MLLSVSLFTIGCQPQKPAGDAEDKPAVEAPAEGEAPAEEAAPAEEEGEAEAPAPTDEAPAEPEL